MTNEVRAWWEATADYFQSTADVPEGADWTGAPFGDIDLDLLGDVRDHEILELGCGGGQCSVGLAEQGAEVVGLDLSSAQLAHAEERASERGVSVEFVEGDVTQPPFAPESFDLACNSYVFQWVGDLDACFRETHRVLRPGGEFVFSVPHPAYAVVDSESERVTESYFDTGRYEIHHEEVETSQVLYRHTVSGIHRALVDAGFVVDALHEPGTDDPDDYEPGPWGECTPSLMSKLPAVLVVEARKPE